MVQPDRRGILRILIVTWALVVARTAIFLWYEQANFEADQAIYGLMAKHLVEGRAFPLFMYGQDYMLAVDSYLAAPFFALLGPSAFALHLSGLVTNLVIATLLVVTLVRYAGLRPWQALVASLPFVFPPPVTAAELTEAGGNTGPFLYIPLLWLLRKRPVAFGTVIAIGTMHREFTAYALPVILAQEAWSGDLWDRTRLRTWLVAVVVALATWQGVQALRPFSDARGPGTRGLPPPADAGFSAVSGRMTVVPSEFPARVTAMLRHHFPSKFGAATSDSPVADQGHPVLLWPFMLGLLFTAVAAAAGDVRKRRLPATRAAWMRQAEFPIYLFGVGLAAMAGYIATRPAEPFIDRYALLIIYLPVGLVAWCLVTRPRAWVAAVPVATMIVMAGAAAVDHRALLVRYLSGSEHDDVRAVADELDRRHVSIAISDYWRAYRISFYTQERVKVASADYVRIDEYQHLAKAAGDGLLLIQRRPCDGGERIDEWSLCPGGSRAIP